MQKILVSQSKAIVFICILKMCVCFICMLAYAISKYGVTLSVMGMSEEFRSDGIAVNALWPRTGDNSDYKVLVYVR